MKYFAYGSNMCFHRFKKRVPSGIFETVATLPCYVLRFHVKDEDGSGKCDAFYTGKQDDFIIGVVYDIEATEKHLLDKAEDLGTEYRQQEVTVKTNRTEMNAFLYVAIPEVIDANAIPYHWYKDFVVKGAREHKLPEEYIKSIERIPSTPDPDRQRANKNRLILYG